MSSGKKVINTIISVLLWIVILVAALYSFVTLATKDESNVASIAGISPMVVQTDSMAPTFETGDLIFVKKCDPESLEVGDIVTFHTIIDNKFALNTHRIAEINEDLGARSYVTKGDNNAIEDDHVIADGDIVGKYMTKIAKFGKVIDFLSSKIGFLLVIVLPMLLFFIYQVYHLIMISIELKKAAALEAAREAAEIIQNETESKNAAVTAEETDAAAEAAKAKAEAEKALAEAMRLKEEAEKALAEAKASNKTGDN